MNVLRMYFSPAKFRMNPEKLISRFYSPGSKAFKVLLDHGRCVAEKSTAIAVNMGLKGASLKFINEAAMLHDIGIFLTDAPSIGCFGCSPYICHGFLGRNLLDGLGFPKHALVAERHTGAGITANNIITNSLPLPCRDMVPLSIEEKIICIADKFYSKSGEQAGKEKSIDEIIEGLAVVDATHAERFLVWVEEFFPFLNME